MEARPARPQLARSDNDARRPRARGVKFHSLTEAIDTDTPTGRAMWQMIGVLAELGRSLISERTRAGVKAAQRREAVLMLETMMAALDADDSETSARQRRYQVRPRSSRTAARAATLIRWVPTNSRTCSGPPSTSRHNSTASRLRSVTSSRDRA